MVCLLFTVYSVCMGSGLHRPFPRNSLQCMVLSGAKGSSVSHTGVVSLKIGTLYCLLNEAAF